MIKAKMRSRKLRYALYIIIVAMAVIGLIKLHTYWTVNDLVYAHSDNRMRTYNQSAVSIWLVVPELISIHKALDEKLLAADTRGDFLVSDMYSFNARRRAWHALEAFQARSERARIYIRSVPIRERR